MNNTRIILCDDHRIITDGLRRLLEGAPGVECVGAADDGPEALELLRHMKADVLITDLDMPQMDGATLTERAKALWPSLRVLVLSMHDEPALVRRALEAGADGYLVKTAGRDELLLAIGAVMEGRKHFGSGVMEGFLRDGTGQAARSELLQGLTEREVEVLAALAEGLSNKEVGARLHISPRTADTHRTNLMRKLGVHNVAGLVRIAIRAGLTG
ncbi:MAG: response regulator [Flavobacteriales bacterium]